MKTVRRPVVGSKQWYRAMRVAHMSLWTMPLLPVGYAVSRTEWDGSIKVVSLMTTPWLLTAIALAMLSHALWRIEEKGV